MTDDDNARAEVSLTQMQLEVRACNEQNGWFDSKRTVGDDVALLHSEVSEMFEAYREHGLLDTTKPEFVGGPPSKPEGFGSELADVLVRVLDTAERHGIDLFAEWRRKLNYNWTREYRHGGKQV